MAKVPVQYSRTTLNVPPSANLQGGAAAWNALGQTANGLADLFANEVYRRGITSARQEGLNTTFERDANGIPRAPTEGPINTDADRARSEAAQEVYRQQRNSAVATRWADLRDQNRNDPSAFRAAMDADISGITAQVPDGMRGQATNDLTMLRDQHYRGALQDHDNRVYAQNGQVMGAALQDSAQELGLMNLQGLNGTPEFQRKLADYNRQVDVYQRAGYTTPEGAQLMRTQLGADQLAYTIGRHAKQINDTQGPDAAERYVAEKSVDPALAAASPHALSQMRMYAASQIQLGNQQRSLMQQGVRQDISTIEESVSSGVTVAPALLIQKAMQAEQAGIPFAARELRALAEVQDEMKSASTLPLPQLAQASSAARNGDPLDPASAMKTRLYDRMINQRLQQLQQDPVGYANSTPTVQAALQNVQAGQGTMADVQAARDLVLRDNGVMPLTGNILSKAERTSIANTLANADPAAAAQTLQSLFDGYGPKLSTRVWNDLRDAGVPKEYAPLTVMMQSQQGRQEMPAYIQTLRVGPQEMLKSAAGKNGNVQATRLKADEAVADQMANLDPTFHGTGFDVGLRAQLEQAVSYSTMFYMARGQDATAAAKRAYDNIVGSSIDVISRDNMEVRIPKGLNLAAPQVARTLDMLSGTELMGKRFRIPPDAVGRGPGMTDADVQHAYARSLMANHFWTTSPDGMGAMMLDANHQPVVLEDGSFYAHRYDQPMSPNSDGLGIGAPGIGPLGSNIPQSAKDAIAPLAAREGLPSWLPERAAQVESGGFHTDGRGVKTSSAGAKGMFQLMPATARGQGVDPNNEAQNMQGGVRYLGQLYRQFDNNPVLMAVAYNMGPGAASKWLAQGGRWTDLPNETQNYVERFFERPVQALLPGGGRKGSRGAEVAGR